MNQTEIKLLVMAEKALINAGEARNISGARKHISEARTFLKALKGLNQPGITTTFIETKQGNIND